jgi:hypothetical protein
MTEIITKEFLKLVPTPENKIGKWCYDMIKGPTGFESYEEHELVVWHLQRELAVAEWIIRCLANKDNKEAADVLQSILKQRGES